jgi:hypothetical protein
MKIGTLVKHRNKQRLGIVLDTRWGSDMTMALVQWIGGKRFWTELHDLEAPS